MAVDPFLRWWRPRSGASLFSVGLVHASLTGNDVIVVLAGATGAIAVALQIGYLPAIYQALTVASHS